MSKYDFVAQGKIKERRLLLDRRNLFVATTFPVLTRKGTWVRKECRITPERRVSNIDVTEDRLDGDKFMELFSEFT